jgi:hypothetical protein
MNFHVFIFGHGSSVIKILNVEGTKFGTRGGDRAVQEEFGCGEAGGMGGRWSGEIKAITAGTIPDAVSSGLGGADAGLLLAVSDLAALRDAGFGDEENGVGAGNAVLHRAVGANTLSEPAKVIGHAAEPQGTAGSLDEETIVHDLSSGGMNDGVGLSWRIKLLGSFVRARLDAIGSSIGRNDMWARRVESGRSSDGDRF